MNELDLQCLEDTNARVRAIYAAYDDVESHAQAGHQKEMRRIKDEAIAREQEHNIEIGGMILFGMTMKNQKNQMLEAKFKYSDSEFVNIALMFAIEKVMKSISLRTGTAYDEISSFIFGTATKNYDQELEVYLLGGLFFRDPRLISDFMDRRKWYQSGLSGVSPSESAIAVATAQAQDAEVEFLREMLDCCGTDRALKLHEQYRQHHAFKHASLEAEVATFALMGTVNSLIQSMSRICDLSVEDATAKVTESVSNDYDEMIQKYLGTDSLIRDPRLDAGFKKEKPWYQPKTRPRPRAAP